MENEIININGIEYRRISLKGSSTTGRTSRFAALSIAASYLAAIDYMNFDSGIYIRKLDADINIVDEYGLIQQKKSKLSRWEREAVINIFERNYEKI